MRKIYILWFLLWPLTSYGQTGTIKASINRGCAPLSVSFTFSQDDATGHQWDLGNGNTSNVAAPSVLYDVAGTYHVTLTVTLASGQPKTVQLADPIQVSDAPTVDFSVSGKEFCNGDTVRFTNASTGAYRYVWDFGDGSTSDEISPSHSYENSSDYTVTLIAFDAYGCTGVKVLDKAVTVHQIADLDFTVDAFEKCEDNAAVAFTAPDGYSSWLWDFGDGHQSSAQSPGHTYQNTGIYTVSLIVEDTRGCSASLTKEELIEITEKPTVKIKVSDTSVCTGSEISISNRTKNTASVVWLFHDGFSSTEGTVTRTYDTAGTYGLTVIITDANGCTSEKVYDDLITVIEAAPPVIDISDMEGCTPFEVNFRNDTPDGVTFYWETDGQLLAGQQVSHIYDEPGIYSLTARTAHSPGCESTIVYDSTIIVHESEVTLAASRYSGCNPLTTSFSFSTNEVSDILWDLGNGTVSSEAAPTVTYTHAGSYPVSATFTNRYGCRETLALPNVITVPDTTIIYITPDPITTCRSVNVYFSGGMGRDFWQWNFGDGNTSGEENPIHMYDQPGTYTVSLTTNNDNGCRSTISTYNEIIVQDVEAAFNATVIDSTECPSFTIRFENLSPGADRLLWDFGDGSQSTEPNPIHHYTGTTQFSVSLRVWNTIGCMTTASNIVSSPWPYCEAGPDDPPGGNDSTDIVVGYNHVINLCSAPAEVRFNNPRGDADSWLWSFGDGNTSTLQDPTHDYDKEGTYTVNLISFYANGKADTLGRYATVNIRSPEVNFTYDLKASCSGTEVSFINTSVSPVLWSWDLGNGSTSTQRDPAATYSTPGVYQVELNAMDSLGCAEKVVKNVIIGNPYQRFSYPQNICFGDSLRIVHNLEGYKAFEWDFGDGNTSTEVYPQHKYAAKGEYVIEMTAKGKNDCATSFILPHSVTVNQPIADFEVDGEKLGCNSLETAFKNLSEDAETWSWDFGDGGTSQNADPRKIFLPGSHTVSLTAGNNGCSDTRTYHDLIVVDDLKADFGFDQSGVCLPATIRFTDKSLNASEWLWDFGDGHQSTEQNPVHIYQQFPESDVTLEVKNSNGCTQAFTQPVYPFLRTDFEASSTAGCVPFTVSFTDQTQGAASRHWDFGDGTSSEEQNPAHVYKTTGTYTVTLTTREASGCEDRLVKKELITATDVQASFTADIGSSTCTPVLISFTNASSGASAYQWDFGDGSSSTGKDPFHVYTGVGQFDVTLTTTNDTGCTDTLTFDKLVTADGPQTRFQLSDSVVCHPETIRFSDESVSAVKWKWFFGDGNASDTQSPDYTYAAPGTYAVSLLATDDKGCQQLVKYDSLRVHPVPNAQFQISDYDHCLPVTLEVSNTSTKLQNSSWSWDMGDGTGAENSEPVIRYDKPGTYRLSLTATNEATCKDTFTWPQDIIVYDTAFQAEPEVQQLSVVDDQEIVLKYSPYPYNNLKYTVVYRQDAATSGFMVSDTLWSVVDETYEDHNVIPAERPYAYRLQHHVYCHAPALPGDLTVYRSIHTTSAARENDIFLQWTGYEGHTFDHYSVLRKPQEGGQPTEIAQLPPDQTSFADTEDLCPSFYTYQVVASQLNGSQYNSTGNTSRSRPVRNVFKDQTVELVRSTVEENSFVFSEWKEPVTGPDKVVYYEVWRSADGSGYALTGEVPAGITSYLDKDVDVQASRYEYRIKVINNCNIESTESNEGSSLLLQKETKQYLNTLRWTPYAGWMQGVSAYLLQRLNEFGEWETVKVLEADRMESTVDLNKEEN